MLQYKHYILYIIMDNIEEIDDIQSIDDKDSDIESEEYIDNITSDDSVSYLSNSFLSNDETYLNSYIDNNYTNKFMTKFELTSILSIRSQQIARGCKPLIEIIDNMYDPYEIARLELKNNKCPLMIRRYNTNNKYNDIKINDLIIKHDF